MRGEREREMPTGLGSGHFVECDQPGEKRRGRGGCFGRRGHRRRGHERGRWPALDSTCSTAHEFSGTGHELVEQCRHERLRIEPLALHSGNIMYARGEEMAIHVQTEQRQRKTIRTRKNKRETKIKRLNHHHHQDRE